MWGKGKRESSYACREEEGCVGVCLTKAPYRNDKIEIVEELCTDCRACVDRCDLGALIIK
ncbi:4Fe-4S binding protein [Candidatus Pacearchaeota archaeon]|nr:4Fe-4S binding protein [Candidatus Pacearchaeota archaeon]